jgi:opacity protein-like surface antigen
MKTTRILILPCMTILASAMSHALAEEHSGATITGEVTTNLYYFDQTGGPGGDFTHYTERNNAQEAWSGKRHSGSYGDLDLSLTVTEEDRDIFTLERRGFGLNNHRGEAKVNTETLGASGYYSKFRSASNGFNYLYNPNLLPADNNGIGGTDPAYFHPAERNANSGYFAQFNNDSPEQTTYSVDRTRFGVGTKLKPPLLGDKGSVSLNYDGYKREGNRFATYVLGGGDIREAVTNAETPGRVLQRWRGFDQTIDESMNKVSLNISATPAGLFQVSYDASLEAFNNYAQDYTHADVVVPDGWQYNTGGNSTRPLGFVPDSSLMTHAVRVSKNIGDTALATGYGLSSLQQDSFTAPQLAAGFTTGKITTNNAYVSANHRVSPTLGVEGHIKYFRRDNDSSYPVPGFLDGGLDAGETLGVRVNRLESLSYEVLANMRGLPLKSSLTPGWKREDKDRDLTFHANAIIPEVSLYQERSLANELYLKWSARPIKGMTLRVTPSFVWADKTGLISEPERALNLKTLLSYALENGMYVSGYYNYKRKENNNNSFTNKTVDPDLALSYAQNLDNTLNSAGASLNLSPAEGMTATLSLDWAQNDLESYYFSTDRRRFEAAHNAMSFLIRGTSAYKVDTWSLSLNGDWEASSRLKLSAGYTYSLADGNSITIDSTQVEPYVVRDTIDNSAHNLTIGAQYALKKNISLRGAYLYDRYSDDAYPTLNGGLHTVVMGLSFAF